jgi:hypothetical protein
MNRCKNLTVFVCLPAVYARQFPTGASWTTVDSHIQNDLKPGLMAVQPGGK